MKVLLVSSYELGHQPFHVASAAAALRSAGHSVRFGDLARHSLDGTDVAWAEGVGFAVPMHTAMRVALDAANEIAVARPHVQMCFYGLYAVTSDLPAGATAIAGEYEPGLVAWAAGAGEKTIVNVDRSAIELAPDRSDLGDLGEYVGLELAGEHRIAGSTAASRGCRYRCRHCPVPTIYDGRYRVVDPKIVIEDISAQVAVGARHISFSDPDFLNGPVHSLRILEAARDRHPDLTFDVTIKVEHLLKHRSVLPRMADLGVLFVVSAFETTNDKILQILDKGHTRADMTEAVHSLRAHAIDVRPTWLPFTPWTEMADLVDMLRFLEAHSLDVDPIQLTIRLLVPRGSLLLDSPHWTFDVESYDPVALTHRWRSSDPALDLLQTRLSQVADLMADESPQVVLGALTREILKSSGLDEDSIRLSSGEGRPRLTEPWFC